MCAANRGIREVLRYDRLVSGQVRLLLTLGVSFTLCAAPVRAQSFDIDAEADSGDVAILAVTAVSLTYNGYHVVRGSRAFTPARVIGGLWALMPIARGAALVMYADESSDLAVGSVEAIAGAVSLLAALGAAGSDKEQPTPVVFRTSGATVFGLAGVF